MQDAQTFVRLNPQIPNLIAIADKAAVLGVTLPTGSTENIEKASSQLLALLTPLVGYNEFVVAREKSAPKIGIKRLLQIRKNWRASAQRSQSG
ncbi:hypothetical protein LP421_32895 (plasmid) [Rhizobium sp. RCAM05350]|uniref:hypothetical protein n=1 Tax=Rhizobium sp. RCAM05350 TaxID=2895568 RepID=UPI0020767AD1|nr:hypothetical protein [Rhizobium sp. RCAM05350]URK89474.1 hypothetical protein LP421_32895 [Rhizobium sp. RCAM05350]